jgi:hypothetical protein
MVNGGEGLILANLWTATSAMIPGRNNLGQNFAQYTGQAIEVVSILIIAIFPKALGYTKRSAPEGVK